jgi:Gpi18-like mannosyltransferase
VTSTLAHGAHRSLGEQARPLGPLAASPALIALLLAGLALRLTIAYVLFPSSGFETDIASYASWALTLASHGADGFYANAGFVDYPPGYLYLLWPIGLLAQSLGPDAHAVAASLVKVPPVLVDAVVGYVIYRLVLGWAWPGGRAQPLALLAAALYVFNPVTIYDSALWGQSDSVGALVLLLGVAALIRGNSEGAVALAALAALVKPQFGVVLIPLVAVMLLKRHLWRPGSGPRNTPWGPRRLARWLARRQGPVRLLSSLAAGLAVFFAAALPFGLGIVEYLELMARTAGGYSYLTVNAFNPWALVGAGGAAPLTAGLSWSSDTVPFLGPVPAVVIGGVLLAAAFLWVLARAALRDDRWTLLVALAVLATAFFVLPTRVHERYIFPALALLPLLAVARRPWLLALVGLSLGSAINLHAILTLPLYGTPNVESLPLGEASRSASLIILSALLQTAVLAFALWSLRPSARSSPDAFSVASASAWPGGRTAAPETGEPLRPGPFPPSSPPPVRQRWVRGPGVLDWLASRVSPPPLRRSRGEGLVGEPGGRLGRVDLLVLVVLVGATLTLRGYRLDEPLGMYFDEVYHARTATEFLQHWEYGEPHAIYEYTHPHLAKYLMALGIRLAGGNHVTGTADLGVPVRGAVIEPGWGTGESTPDGQGDRLFVGTGGELRVHDLSTRQLVRTLPLPVGPLALDAQAHRLYAAAADGVILSLDTAALGPDTGDPASSGSPETFSGGPGGAVRQMVATPVSIVSRLPDGRIASFDPETGLPMGDARVPGATDMVTLPWADRIVVETADLLDPAAVAERLAQDLGDDAGRIERLLASGPRLAVVAGYPAGSVRDLVQESISDGELVGVTIEGGPLLAVSGADGISLLDARTLDEVDRLTTLAPVRGLALVERGLGEPTLFAASGSRLEVVPLREDGPAITNSVWMPGSIRMPAWNEPAGLLHVLGDTPEGEPVVYAVELNGRAVFADAPLPADPDFLLVDTQPERPWADRGQLLAVTGAGAVAAVDIRSNAFAWRLPGVILGALAAGLLYLLARVLIQRRSVAVLAGLLVLAEGMLFANSRIAMNDVYVTTFMLLAVVLVAPVYLGTARGVRAGALLLGAGVALGVALASKWVALYAVGGLVLLVLLRSALGRLLALGGMLALTAVLGGIAVRPAAVDEANRNWTFVILMLILTGLLAGAIARRPLPFTRAEARLAIGGALLAGVGLLAGSATLEGPVLEGLVTPFRLRVAGGAAALLGAAALGGLWLAGRLGLGPFGPASDPAAGAPAAGAPAAGKPAPGLPDGAPGRPARVARAGVSAWLTPARAGGIPWVLGLAMLTVLPVAIYVASYAPWVDLGNQWLPGLPGGHSGQTLAQLTSSMYQYHDDLRAEHAASSPWWAWPLDLKPVWFYQEQFAGRTTGLIHDAGNLVVFWLGLPAMAFAAWAAWRRRSLSLALVVLMWLALWLPWARIDRATFQYHVHTSLPFLVLGLAYLLAELWHGPGTRTWFLARLAVALAILGVPLLWLVREPLCRLAGTEAANPGGVACGEIARTAQLTPATLASLAIVALGVGVALGMAWRSAGRPYRGDSAQAGRHAGIALPRLLAVALAVLAAVLLAHVTLPPSPAVTLSVSPEALAAAGLAVLAAPAWLVIRARDPRRLVGAVVILAGLWLLLWYPNLAGLPLPAAFAHVYQGVLPTWNWDFQFAVNLDPPTEGGMVDATTLVLGAVSVLVAAGGAAVARSWGGRDPRRPVAAATLADPGGRPGPVSRSG